MEEKRDSMADAYYIGLMQSTGYREKDLKKPVIGIVNSWNDVNPGHKPFRELAGYVKEGVWAAGGAPAEFTVPAPCDGMAQLIGMQYILPQRDLIAASVEAMAKAHAFLAGRDFVVPEDVAAVFPDVCAHRLILSAKARMMEEKAKNILAEILKSVDMPVLKA